MRLNVFQNISKISYPTSFAWSKEVSRKDQPMLSSAVETMQKNSEPSGIPFSQFQLSQRFFASSKTLTSQKAYLSGLGLVSVKPRIKKLVGRRQDFMFDSDSSEEFEILANFLYGVAGGSRPAALVSPFRQKVIKKELTILLKKSRLSASCSAPVYTIKEQEKGKIAPLVPISSGPDRSNFLNL